MEIQPLMEQEVRLLSLVLCGNIRIMVIGCLAVQTLVMIPVPAIIMGVHHLVPVVNGKSVLRGTNNVT